jgi:PTH1 family peptidyl-tRNA hydrolase
MFCVAGLGNPGERYKDTRHNLGFRVAERLAERCNTSIRRSEFRALTAAAKIGRSEVLLLEPQTYMNLCGGSIDSACSFHGIPPERLIVAFDDADLPLGRVRVRRGGGTGGHRGVASIIETVGSAEFVRVRLGLGRPPAGLELSEWVLEPVPEGERSQLDALVERGADAVVSVIVEGVEAAMRNFNGAVPDDATKQGT